MAKLCHYAHILAISGRLIAVCPWSVQCAHFVLATYGGSVTSPVLTRRMLGLSAASVSALAVTGPAVRAQTKVNLRYANAGNAQSLSNLFNAKLFEDVTKKSDGSLTFVMFDGTMGGEQKLLESMALGGLDMYNGAYTGTREFDILYSPYFFKDGAQAGRVMKGPIGEKASAVLEKRYHARLLGTGRLGTYNLMLKQPIKSFADLKGRKIRTASIEGCLEGVKFFGGIPTPIPFDQIYLALQQGIVDGVLTALNPGVAGKFYEVCKYVVSNDFGIALDKEVISQAAWNRLSAPQRSTLQDEFNALEVSDYYEVGLKQKSIDLGSWAKANGQDSVITLDAGSLYGELEPLNARLANEVYGAGSWDMIKNA
jgi:TRAP-type C4-dicarboxylate transport system substrate-binding protein